MKMRDLKMLYQMKLLSINGRETYRFLDKKGTDPNKDIDLILQNLLFEPT